MFCRVKRLLVVLIISLSLTGCAKTTAQGTPSTVPVVTVGTEESTTPVETVETDSTVPEETESTSVSENVPETETTVPTEPEEVIDDTVTGDLPSTITVLDKTMYVTQSCNVRDTPSTTGVKKYSLAKGDAVHVIGQDNDSKWYQLENGFVSDKYLTDKKPTAPTTTETKPVTTTPSPSTTTTTPSTPTTPSTTPESTPAPASTACQHKNVIRQVLSITRSCTDTFEYKVICADCGAVINEHLVETAPSVSGHHITETYVLEQSWICGSQEEIGHYHYQCDCGEVNYDGPSTVMRNAAHSFRPYQFYDAEGNLCEGQYCGFCGYEDPNYTIIQYAEP